MVQATDGNFYGTTYLGGANGEGTVFEISSDGMLTTLHSFGGTDGSSPYAGVIQARDGNFYGTTPDGGAYNLGTVFEITPLGDLTTLYSFCAAANCADGDLPYAGVIQATDGNFYGTTTGGGAYGYGTVFEINSADTLTTLHSFGGADGASTYAGLLQGADGNFYGTTPEGGAGDCNFYGGPTGCGTVFEISPAGTLTTLHFFDGTDGAFPETGLVQATNGNFYGTTALGGGGVPPHGSGTVFQITTEGTLTTLRGFDAIGRGPNAVVQGTDGDFYATTQEGGAFSSRGAAHPGDGTIFSLSVKLAPFVETNPASGGVGAKVVILGNNLQGATSIMFNGTPVESFSVNSSGSAITTAVPAGASTGPVSVKTPSGTLNSNEAFEVRP